MKTNANILVGLDLSEMDTFLLEFISEISNLFSIHKASFIHVIPEGEIPDEIEQLFPDLDEPLEKVVENDISSSLEESFKPSGEIKHEIIIKRGDRSDTIVGFSRKNNIDLIILGLKQELSGTGVAIDRVAAFAGCSTLFVPEYSRTSFKQLLAIINFNKISQQLLEDARDIARLSGGEVQALHVYGLPVNYFPGSPTDKLRKKMGEECRKKFDKIIRKIDGDSMTLNCEFLLDDQNDKASVISKYIRKINIDLLILGLKDRSDSSFFYIHTITEKLRNQRLNLPLWIVKERKPRQFFGMNFNL